MEHKKLPLYDGKDQTGKLYHSWEVLYELERKPSKDIKWKCRCIECNREFEVYKKSVINGGSKRCKGCSYSHRSGENSPVWKGYKDIPGEKFQRVEKRARTDNIDISITIEDLQNIWENQNGACNLSGVKLDIRKTASLDRIDSKKGYNKDNIQWVHKKINMMKQHYSQDEFLKLCSLIYGHQKNKIMDYYEYYKSIPNYQLMLDD